MKKLDEFKEKMSTECIIKNKELYLTGLSLFLLGIVIGIIFSPKKYSEIFSNNGNYSGYGIEPELDEEDD